MFDSMDDTQFACWLAGFFDGEGCIHIPKFGVEVSIASTDRAVIEAIQQRTGIGVVVVVTYDKVEWKTKYHWRVRNYPQAGAILRFMRPFLAIKGAKADEALVRTDKWDQKRALLKQRNQEILDMVASGKTCKETGKYFGLSPESVRLVVRGMVKNGDHPVKVKDIRIWRKTHETKAVKSAGLDVHTTSHYLLPLPA